MPSFSLHAIIRANMVQHNSVWPEEGLKGWNTCICALTVKLAIISYGLLKMLLPEIFQDDDQVALHADSVVAEHTHWSTMCSLSYWLSVSPVAARASSVQEAVPAPRPHAKSPQDCRPEWPVLTRSGYLEMIISLCPLPPFLYSFLFFSFFLFVTPHSFCPHFNLW